MTAPNPIEHHLARHVDPEPELYRNLSCDHYSNCLELAVKRGWTDWACTACARFRVVRPVDLGTFAHDRRGRE